MKVVPVPVFSDNYAYLLIDEATKEAAAIDPAELSKVREKADELGVKLTSLITTHFHYDHSGGNQHFASEFPDAPIYGGSQKVPAVTHILKDGDTLTIGKSVNIKCLATPCHTRDSICFYVTDATDESQKAVFTGDTLFIGGCGRFFEGTAEEMHAALNYLSTLPSDTITYVGHEYTASNLKFAAQVDPDNQDIHDLVKFCQENEVSTGKTTIADEKKFNVFMRLDTPAVRKATGASTTVGAMDRLRTMKNNM